MPHTSVTQNLGINLFLSLSCHSLCGGVFVPWSQYSPIWSLFVSVYMSVHFVNFQSEMNVKYL